MIHRRILIAPFLIVLALLRAIVPAEANMAAPLRPGTALGEPRAALSGLAIESERLELDLRPLAFETSSGGASEDLGRALVSATYVVRNDSVERPVTLEFVAQAIDTAQWSVMIDGRPIVARYRSAEPGKGWPAPKTTPGLDGAPLEYEAHAMGILRFDAVVPAGRHSIRVEYVAVPTRQVVDDPLVHWQLGYILEPAKRWPSFGTLEVIVKVPPGWRVATEPRLARAGDVLTGRFEGIPSDALTITARGVYEPWYAVLAWLPAAVAFLLGSVAAYRLGRTIGRRLARDGRGAAWGLPAALGAAFVLAVAIPAAGLAGRALEESLIGEGQRAWGEYGFLIVEVLITIVAFVVGLILVQTGVARSIRRARRRYDARWIDAYPDTAPTTTLHTNGAPREHGS
jgi:hypothetical protein